MTKRLLGAIKGIREKEIDSFEEFFFLTHKGMYQFLSACEEDEEKVWEYLKQVYVKVWKENDRLPGDADLESWHRSMALYVTDKSKEELPEKGKITPNQNLEERFETFFVEIEDELGFLDSDGYYLEDEKESIPSGPVKERKTKWISLGIFSMLLVATAVLAFQVMQSSKKDAESLLKTEPMMVPATSVATTQTNTPKAENADDSDAAKFGWNQYKDGWKYKNADGKFVLEDWLEEEGKVYYLNESGYMAVGTIHLGVQNFTFDQSGELEEISRFTYEIEQNETDLGRQLVQQGMSDLKTFIVDNSIVKKNGWIYYLSRKNPEALPDFCRLQDGAGVLEEIAQGVSGYILVEEHAWYYKDEKMQYFMTLNKASSATDQVTVTDANERFILKDAQGNPVSIQESESVQIGPRIYHLKHGEIVSVERIPTTLGSYTFIRSNADYDNNIYTEDGKKFLTQGYWITDMCLVGNELYYSTIIRFDAQKKPVSQLYKIDINTGERRAISGIFEGRVNKMYYYPENAAIFMEYSPIGAEHTFGRILEFDINQNKLYLIHDEEKRAQKGASDRSRLRVITTDANNLYAYIEEGTYNPSKKDMDVRAIYTLQLDLQNKAEMPQE